MFLIKQLKFCPLCIFVCLFMDLRTKQRLLACTESTDWFLGAFRKMRNATVRVVMSARTRGTSRLPLDGWSWFFYFGLGGWGTKIIIINIKDWTLWSVPSPKLQLLSPTFLRSSNCSPSLRSVVVRFQRDSVLWHSLQVLKPVLSVFIYLV